MLLWTPLAWAGGVVAAVVLLTGTIAPERYTIGAIPGFCLIAATLAAWQVTPAIRRAALAALVCVLAVQTAISASVRPVGLSGYETAAEWVLAHTKAPTVMFNGPIDTGMFSFFLRKHDAQQRLVMLRADKLFATSLMGWHGLTQQIDRPEAIYPILQRYGTQYIVLEDTPSQSKALDWLRDALKTPRFAERLRLPLNGSHRTMRGVSLVVYEYLDATAPDPNAVLELDLPLVGRKIVVPLKDLTDGIGARGRVVDLPADRQP
jgi:hypothetical protein